MIAQYLGTALAEHNMSREVAAVVTRVRVSRDDPAFRKPSKPIGPFYTQEEAGQRAERDGWAVREDSGRGWRRVVPSPLPQGSLAREAIKSRLHAGLRVIAAGGVGVPVAGEPDGAQVGIEAVVDKDRASALLASELGLSSFVIVTGVDYVAINFGKPDQQNLEQMTVAEAERYLAAGEFGEGSMKPKIESALQFLAAGGSDVLITSPEALSDALSGKSGTRIVR